VGPSNLRADLWRRLPAGALAKVGRRFGWQAVASLGPQAPYHLKVKMLAVERAESGYLGSSTLYRFGTLAQSL
jgi:hypothetical protein